MFRSRKFLAGLDRGSHSMSRMVPRARACSGRGSFLRGWFVGRTRCQEWFHVPVRGVQVEEVSCGVGLWVALDVKNGSTCPCVVFRSRKFLARLVCGSHSMSRMVPRAPACSGRGSFRKKVLRFQNKVPLAKARNVRVRNLNNVFLLFGISFSIFVAGGARYSSSFLPSTLPTSIFPTPPSIFPTRPCFFCRHLLVFHLLVFLLLVCPSRPG